MENTDHRKHRKIQIRKSHTLSKKRDYKWIVKVSVITFIITALLTFFSGDISNDNVNPSLLSMLPTLMILLIIILTGIIFDVLGIAVTAADSSPFHSLSSRKVSGASQSIFLIKNAEKVSNFCNDMIGDIAGIVSGAITGVIVINLSANFAIKGIYLSVILTSIVSSLTVGGKAYGKYFAIVNANNIVFLVGKLIAFLKLKK